MQAHNATLREYQQHLFDRFHAKAGAVASSSHFGFEAGKWTWVVALTDVSEVIPVPRLVSVPLATDWFVGVANVRGSLFSVTDLARFENAAATPTTSDSRLVVLHARYRAQAALLVRRSLGLRQVKALNQSDVESSAWQCATYADSDGRIWRELNVAELTRSTRFLQIAPLGVETYGGPEVPAATSQENQ